MRTNPYLAALCLLVGVFMLGPVLLSVSAGFMQNYALGWRGGLTLQWLLEVWRGYGSTVLASIGIASAAVICTILIGLPCAYALARSKRTWALWFEELITLPVAVPGLATALALILVYGEFRGFRQHAAFILAGHVIFTMPFMVRVLTAAFRRPELRTMEEAASTLGASFKQRFLGVLIPTVLPAVLSGALMVFTLSIGEFNLTWMLHTPLTRTLPVGLADSYASMRIEIGSAYTFVFLIVVLPLLWLMQLSERMLAKRYAH